MLPLESIKKLKRKRPKGSGKRNPKAVRYSTDFKVKAVKLYLEEGYPAAVISQELRIGQNTLHGWIKLYQAQGEAGLEPRYNGTSRQSLPQPIKDTIVEVKKKNPGFGSKRISQFLRRMFFLPASPETVRKTLHEEELMPPQPRRKPRRNVTRPRFFERSTPNQMWQSDIFTFRLGGHYAYLIGYIDDYSRYLTGLDLFRSQTADHVIEVYRKAIGEYNPPKEMLTDNGRQYTNWRGTTRFEAELKKDNIRHLRSQPHHPMTLGKIERFWKTIYQEFLSRAQFISFDDARERIRIWVKYYNHQRPHQGIKGLCPAERYFEVQSEMKKVIEQGIKDNMLEMALRGKPRKPFYMVGRMEGQSVVLHAEKGKLKLSVDDEEHKKREEMVYNLAEGGHTDGEEKPKENGEDHRGQSNESELGLRRDAALPGSAGGVDGPAAAGPGVPGAVDPAGHAPALAGPGPGGDAAGPGTPGEAGEGDSPFSPPAGHAGEAAADAGTPPDQDFETSGPTGPDPGCPESDEKVEPERSVYEPEGGPGPETGIDHHAGPERTDNGRGGSPETGDLPQNVLPVGKAGPDRDDEGPGEPGCGPACPVCGYREGAVEEEKPETGAGTAPDPTAVEGQGHLPGKGQPGLAVPVQKA